MENFIFCAVVYRILSNIYVGAVSRNELLVSFRNSLKRLLVVGYFPKMLHHGCPTESEIRLLIFLCFQVVGKIFNVCLTCFTFL